jgi:TolB-like protein/tetratricopeptide (TPR) repeat protein
VTGKRGAPTTEDSAATIAVLPFENPSGDPDQEYFARGFVEDVVTELSRFPTLEVIHPQTSFTLARGGSKARLPDDLRVGYFLHGSVRRLGDTVRVAAQLVEADSGRQVWADRFDAPADRLLAVQDEIVACVASTLAVQIDSARLHQARRKPVTSLEVYDCWLRGLDCLRRGTVDDDERARGFFEQALTRDPNWARAHAGISLSHFNEWSCQAWELWDDKERLAFEHARRAADLEDRDALVQLVLGRILLYRRQFDEAARHVDRAIDLNPNDADVLAQAALCRAYLGDSESGVALATKATRLNPHHPDWYSYCAAVPLFLLQRYGEAVALVSKAPRATVDLPAYLAATYALMGDPEHATTSLEMFLADFVEKITFGRPPEPGEPLRWLLHVNPFRRPGDADHFARGLRLAGLLADPDEGRPRAVARPAADSPARAVFRKDGELWRLAFGGSVVQLTEAKGFHDLVELLAKPDAPIHCLELAGRSAEPRGDDPVLDTRARRELASRARELQEQIDEAEALNDRGRAEHAREELERIVTALSDALGLGGRSRRLGSAAERARTAVTWRIRNAIRKIATAHPALGRHFETAVQTGTYCTYIPEKPVNWFL